MTPQWTPAPWPLPAPGEDVARHLEAAADLVEGSPGLNVLDALAKVKASDLIRSQAYYGLLDYLPPHVEYLAPWSDAETSERVATKLRQLARTIRKGGPARIGATPEAHVLVPELDSAARNRGEHKPPGRTKRAYTRSPEGDLRRERATVAAAIARAEGRGDPHPQRTHERRDRLVAIDAALDQLQAADRDRASSPAPSPTPPPPPPEAAAANGARPLAGLGLARRPGTESGL